MPFSTKEQERIKADIMKYYTKNHRTKDQEKLLKKEYKKEYKKATEQGRSDIFKEVHGTNEQQRLARLDKVSQQRIAQQELTQRYEDKKIKLLSEGGHPGIIEVLVNIEVGNLVFLVGPAGSGKTTIAMMVAKILEKDFYFTGAVHQKHELLGFIDAKGKLARTPFREAYENGGLFLFDEFDASSPHAITAFNAALSNGKCAFPDRIVDAHKDFIAIAAGNTYGTGATRQYVGRFQQDAASLDRFVFIEIDYDINLEETLAFKEYEKYGGTSTPILCEYLSHMRDIRRVVKKLGMLYIVSPRAAMMGARLLATGMPLNTIYKLVVFKGMPQEHRKQIMEELKR